MTQALEQRIIETTNALLEEWCLDGWTVKFGSAKKRLGSCNYTDKVLRFSRVFIECFRRLHPFPVEMNETQYC